MSEERKEELATVTGAGFGMRDFRDGPGLWFGVETLRGGALLCFHGDEATRLIKEAGCYEVQNLQGRALVVSTAGPGTAMRFVRWK